MCSRVYLNGSIRELLEKIFPFLEKLPEGAGAPGNKSHDVLPTDFMSVIRRPAGGEPEIVHAAWGFIPFGDTDKKRQAQFINARAETLLEKPMWREAARNPAQRCVIPISGFYEWPGGVRHKVAPAEGRGFLIAGLVEAASLRGERGGESFYTFTVITTAPSEEFAAFHDRMPAILDAEAARLWLAEPDVLKAVALLRPAPEGTLRAEESPTRPVQERLL